MSRPRGTVAYDLTGCRFNKLTVLQRSPKTGPVTYWDCVCECGKFRTVSSFYLRSGKTKSCGCWGVTCFQHGRSHKNDRTYKSWAAMIQRCMNPNDSSWNNYGGRGIKVCKRWHKFINFLADMGERPIGLTLDRIETNDNYYPKNCRWATPKVQAGNKRIRTKPWGNRRHNLPIGVYRSGYRFTASAVRKGTRFYLGTFDTADEAARARLRVDK